MSELHTRVFRRNPSLNILDIEWIGDFTNGLSFCRGSIVDFVRAKGAPPDIECTLRENSVADVIKVLKQECDSTMRVHQASFLFRAANSFYQASIQGLQNVCKLNVHFGELVFEDIKERIVSCLDVSPTASVLVVVDKCVQTEVLMFDDLRATIAELEQVQAVIVERGVTQSSE